MKKHTQEPWPHFIEWCEPATPHPDSDGFVGLGFEDYRRARACVNACRGLLTDELEQKGLVAAVGTQLLAADDRADGQEREIRRLVNIAADAENQLADSLNQRDELLSLAERLVQWDIDYPVNCDNGYAGLKALDELIRDNKAAIVKIKGEHSQQPNALLDDVYVAGGAA